MNKGKDARWKRARSLWSKVVRETANHTCLLCRRKQGDGQRFAAHHIIPARVRRTELHVLNGVCLCPSCHRKVHEVSGYKEKLEAAIRDCSALWWKMIERMKREKGRTFTKCDMDEAIEMLKSAGINAKHDISEERG